MDNNQKLQVVLDTMSSIIETIQERYQARIEKLNALWSEANDGLRPNTDRLGRLHAPCNGYRLCEDLDFGPGFDHDHLYRKGEFLPVPLPTDEEHYFNLQQKRLACSIAYKKRDKIKVDYDLAVMIVEEMRFNNYIGMSTGKTWEVNGVKICYLYINSDSDSVLKPFIEGVKSAIENTDRVEYKGESIEGRLRVRGKIQKITSEYMNAGYNQVTIVHRAMIVLDNDSVCYGNLSSKEVFEEGDVVEFTGTFVKSEKHKHVSIYKRPHRMIVIKD